MVLRAEACKEQGAFRTGRHGAIAAKSVRARGRGLLLRRQDARHSLSAARDQLAVGWRAGGRAAEQLPRDLQQGGVLLAQAVDAAAIEA